MLLSVQILPLGHWISLDGSQFLLCGIGHFVLNAAYILFVETWKPALVIVWFVFRRSQV